MIKRLEIKNFRGVKGGSLELAPLTILLGPNNSGKTAILEALFLAPNPLRQVPYRLESQENRAMPVVNFIHRTLGGGGYAFFLHKYIADEAEIKCDGYSIKFTKDNGNILIHVDGINIQLSFDIPKKDRIIHGKKLLINHIGSLSYDHDQITDYSVMHPLTENSLFISSNLLKEAYRFLYANWARIVNLGICFKVAKDASKFSHEEYSDITIEPFLGGQFTINAYRGDGKRIRLGDLGEGMQTYLTARILYETEKPSILLWDDVEAHLNPRMLVGIAGWLSDLIVEGVQVIITTHSLEAVRAIAGLVDEAKILLTSLDNGLLSARPLTLNDVEALLEAGVDVRVAESLL